MREPQASPETAKPSTTQAAPLRLLTGWRLAVARVAWLGLALGALTLYVAALPTRFALLMTPCAAVCAPGQAAAGATTSYAGWLVALDVVFALVYVVMAGLIFWRTSADSVALVVSLTLILWGVTFTSVMNALAESRPEWFLPVAGARFLGAALITVFFFTFPNGRFAPGWARWLALIWAFSQIPRYFLPGSILNPDRWNPWLFLIVSAGFLGVMIALQVYRYRWVSSAAQRRQTKWVVLGIGLSLSGYLVVILLGYVLTPPPGSIAYALYAAALNVSLLLIPLSIGVAVLRDRLYDIDLLIRRSLVYGALSSALVALYAGSVVLLSWLARVTIGQQDNSLAVVVSTLGVVVVFQPLRQRIQRAVDRRFYRRRYNAARALAAFGEVARQEVDLSRLSAQLVEVVERTMEPAHISLTLFPSRQPQTQTGRRIQAPSDARQ